MPDTPSGVSPPAALRREGLRPRKRLGQNFLRDTTYLPRILEAASVDAGDQILEIGAGTGVLTDALAARAGRVVAVELDDALYGLLSERFRSTPCVELLHENALSIDPCEHFSGPYKVVANIPYYITGQVLRHLLESRCRPELAVLMVQREVAERMAARPPHLSLLGVSVQFYADVRVVTRVPPGAFYPPPKVESAIVRLRPFRPEREADPVAFFSVARAGFGQRRKQLANSLSAGLGISRAEAVSMLSAAGIAPSDRAETVPVDAWMRLAGEWADRRQPT